MASLAAAAGFFLAIHLVISGSRLRDVIVRITGERAFQTLFSILSIAGLVWLCTAYGNATHVQLWQPPLGLQPVAVVLMLLAFFFAVIGLMTPSPTAVGGESRLDRSDPARGILRVTRHPFLWGVTIWSAVHLILTGTVASLFLFGTLLLVAALGPPTIDAKRRARFGDKWNRFAAVTSSVPFAAIVQGRNTLVLREFGWWRVGAAFGLFVLFLSAHRWLFGVSALPL